MLNCQNIQKNTHVQHCISKNFNELLVKKNFKIIYSYTLTVPSVPPVLVPRLCVMEIVRGATLPNIALVFSAKLHTIQLALRTITERGDGDYVIVTDSLSSLQSISDKQTNTCGYLVTCVLTATNNSMHSQN